MSHSSASFTHLRVDGLSKSFADRRVFTEVSFAVPHDDRVGIIGENGAGKSTLLRIIAGDVDPDAGRVELFDHNGPGKDVGLLHQQLPFSPHVSVEHVVEASVAPLRAVAHAVDAAAQAVAAAPDQQSVMEGYTTALEQAQRFGVWQLDTRINQTVEGLGLANLDRQEPITQLSGCQAARLALASLLLSFPDMMSSRYTTVNRSGFCSVL